MSLNDLGYGTDFGNETDPNEKEMNQIVKISKGDVSPMKNPYIKSIEAISQF